MACLMEFAVGERHVAFKPRYHSLLRHVRQHKNKIQEKYTAYLTLISYTTTQTCLRIQPIRSLAIVVCVALSVVLKTSKNVSVLNGVLNGGTFVTAAPVVSVAGSAKYQPQCSSTKCMLLQTSSYSTRTIR